MNVASTKLCDCANGPGMRVSVFVSGCRRHCKGCFNQITWDFNYGTLYDKKYRNYINEVLKEPYIDGLSILGGEPFEPENSFSSWNLAIMAKRHGKNVWAYSGFTFEELYSHRSVFDCVYELLKEVDVLVDGPFVEEEKDITLKFRGSRNQRIIDIPASIKAGKAVFVEEYM